MSKSIEKKIKGKNISTIIEEIMNNKINLNNIDDLEYILFYTLNFKENDKLTEELIKLLISKKTTLNSFVFYDFLFKLCELEKLNLIKILLDNELIINCQNEKGETPMHIAIKKNNYPLVNLLMKYSPDLNLCTYKDFLTVYSYAEKCNNNDIKSLILGEYFSNNIVSVNSSSKSSSINIYRMNKDRKKRNNIKPIVHNTEENKYSSNNLEEFYHSQYSKKQTSKKKSSKRINKSIQKIFVKGENHNTPPPYISIVPPKKNSQKKVRNASKDQIEKKKELNNNEKKRRKKNTVSRERNTSKCSFENKTQNDENIFCHLSEFSDSLNFKNQPLDFELNKNNEDYFNNVKLKNFKKRKTDFEKNHILDNSKLLDYSNSNNTNENLDISTSCIIESQKEKMINLFFKEINLPTKFAKNFIENGFDDLDILISQTKNATVITDKILKSIGINPPGNRAKILIHMEEKAGLFDFPLEKEIIYMNTPDDKYADYIYKFLASINLEEYINNFIINGYYSPQLMLMQMITRQPITDEMLKEDLGIDKIGYRVRILNSLSIESINYSKKLKKINQKRNGKEIKDLFILEKGNNGNSCEACNIF